MLIDHIKVEFDVLNRARIANFNLGSWQGGMLAVKESIEHVHECGTTACAGGYLSLSPFWKVWGGTYDNDGAPVLEVKTETGDDYIYADGIDAIYEFFGLNFCVEDRIFMDALALVHGITRSHFSIEEFYDCHYTDVTPRKVQEKLAVFYFMCCVLGVGKPGYFAYDGTKLNADGSRLIFDDVDA